MTNRLKLGILVSHPIQYFVPIYRALASHAEIELTVIYRTRVGVDAYHDIGFDQTVQWDIPLLEGYPHVFLSDRTTLTGIEFNVIRVINRYRFDVLLVHGYNSATNLLALLAAKLLGTKVLLRGDTRLSEYHNSLFKREIKKLLFRLIDGFVYIGSLNRAYYVAHGVPEQRLFFAPFSVDNAFFALPQSEQIEAKKQLRAAWSLPADAVVVLSASKLIAFKRVDDLLRAFALVHEKAPQAWLIIAGSGPDAKGLRLLAEELCITQIRFIGFQNQTDLPKVFAACDLFVMPSTGEPWGLAINEVMATGLPVIVSDGVGAAPDLVAGKDTGLIFPCGDVDALATALIGLLEAAEMRIKMGHNARKVITHWDNAACAKHLISAAWAVKQHHDS